MFVRFQPKLNGRAISHKVALYMIPWGSLDLLHAYGRTKQSILIGTMQACKCLKKATVVYFKVTSQHLFEEPKKSSKDRLADVRSEIEAGNTRMWNRSTNHIPWRLVPKTEYSSCRVSLVESSTIFCQAALRQIFHPVLVNKQFLLSVLGDMFLYCAKWHDCCSEVSFAASTVNIRSATLRGNTTTHCR